MEHCKFRVMDKCKNEECELLMCIGTENCIHFQAEPKEKLEDTIPKWKIDKAIEDIKNIDLIVHDGINHYYKSGKEVKAEVLVILKLFLKET